METTKLASNRRTLAKNRGANLTAVLVTLLALIAFLTACSNSANSDGGEDQAKEAAKFTRELLDSPSKNSEMETRYQQILQTCMGEAGFEYEISPVLSDPYYEPRTLEHVKRFGLGYSTQHFNVNVLPSDLVGKEHFGVGSAEQMQIIPGETAAEREAYTDKYDECDQAAFVKIKTVFPEIEVLESAYTVMFEVDVQPIHDVIFKCVREQGFDLNSTSDLIENFSEPVSELTLQYGMSMSEQGEQISDEIAAELRKIQDAERAAAQALWDCGWFPENSTEETKPLWEKYEADINTLISNRNPGA